MMVSLWLGLIYLHRRTGFTLQELEGMFVYLFVCLLVDIIEISLVTFHF